MGKKYSKQQIAKLYRGHCFFCGEDDYSLLDVHRIVEGANGGTYHPINTLVCCCKCHRRIHAGQIQIDKKYFSTGGMLVHYFIDGNEFWTAETSTHLDG